MKIQDFIQGRTVSYATVFQYIKRHPNEFKGHIGKANNIILDEDAIRILEEKYPLERPVQMIQDTKAREQLQEITEKYLYIVEQNAAAMKKIAELTEQNAKLLVIQSKQRFLEEENYRQENELMALRREKERWGSTFKAREKDVVELEILLEKERRKHNLQISDLNKQLEQEKNKSWWAKLRRK